MIPAFPVYLFDVDGTLLDSQLDICGAIQTVLAARGRTDITHEKLRTYIGRHLIDEFLELGFTRGDIDQMIVEYRAIYPQRQHASTFVYPGIADVLGQIGRAQVHGDDEGHADHPGRPRSVRPHLRTSITCRAPTAFPRSPSRMCCSSRWKFWVFARRIVFSSAMRPTDIEAGQRAGIRTCAVTWGYGDLDELARGDAGFLGAFTARAAAGLLSSQAAGRPVERTALPSERQREYEFRPEIHGTRLP